MKNGLCLGLVGGLGVGATIHYYERLVKAHKERRRTLEIVITHAEVSRVRQYVEADDRNGLAGYLAGFIGRMQAAGAEAAAIPAVTPHICFHELMASSPLPVINIFEPLIAELKAQRLRRVALFGTRFVMESGLFGFLRDVEIVQLKPEEAEYVHRTYMQLAAEGKGTEEQHSRLTVLAHALVERDGVGAIVLAGTDLTVLFNECNTTFPHIDCAAVHIRAIVDELLGVGGLSGRRPF
jgi:aspartate racemase